MKAKKLPEKFFIITSSKLEYMAVVLHAMAHRFSPIKQRTELTPWMLGNDSADTELYIVFSMENKSIEIMDQLILPDDGFYDLIKSEEFMSNEPDVDEKIKTGDFVWLNGGKFSILCKYGENGRLRVPGIMDELVPNDDADKWPRIFHENVVLPGIYLNQKYLVNDLFGESRDFTVTVDNHNKHLIRIMSDYRKFTWINPSKNKEQAVVDDEYLKGNSKEIAMDPGPGYVNQDQEINESQKISIIEVNCEEELSTISAFCLEIGYNYIAAANGETRFIALNRDTKTVTELIIN